MPTRRRSATLCLLSGLLAFLVLLLPAARLAADDPPPRKVALLVGVNQYLKPGFRDLRFAEADVLAVGEELRKLGWQVTLLLGSAEDEQSRATKANIEATTRRLVQPLGKRDVMLIMFSGHGQTLNPDPNADPDVIDLDKFQSYYCPVDAVYNTPESQVALNHLLDDILAVNVGRKLLVLDACRDIPEDRTRPEKNARGIDAARIDLRAGTSVYLSCSFAQRSFEAPKLGHGLFTYCLLEGLRGAATRDGELAWADLVAYVNRRMQSEEMLQYMPPRERQLPFPAGDLTHTVLGKLEVRPVATTPTPRPTVPPSPPQSGDGGEGLLSAPFTPAQAAAARSAAASRLGVPETATNSIGMKLTLIPAGEFLMGSTPAEIEKVRKFYPEFPEGLADAEQPQHRVRITRPFYLGTYEVTKGEFAQFVSATGYKTEAERDGEGGWGWNESTGKFEGRDPKYTWKNTGFTQDDRHPVVNVTWNDATAFCEWLSRKEGVTYRLPTEAEWEYACRAGTTTLWSHGDDPEGVAAVGNVADGTAKAKFSHWATIRARDGHVFTAPVGRFRANGFGLHDMHGNVWEWCEDWYDAGAYQSRSGVVSDPVVTTGEQKYRLLRGGSWSDYARFSRSALRNWSSPVDRDFSIGFRVARTP